MVDDLVSEVKKSLSHGYSVREVEEVLSSQGYSQRRIEEVIGRIREGQTTAQVNKHTATGSGLFSYSNYVVKQEVSSDRYIVENGGQKILEARNDILKSQDKIQFWDDEGNVVVKFAAQQVIKMAGDYSIVDPAKEEIVAVVRKNFSPFKHEWMVVDPESSDEMFRIESRKTPVELFRSVPILGSLLPHKYSIVSDEGKIGQINGELSLNFRFEVEVEKGIDADRNIVVPTALALDALERNR